MKKLFILPTIIFLMFVNIAESQNIIWNVTNDVLDPAKRDKWIFWRNNVLDNNLAGQLVDLDGDPNTAEIQLTNTNRGQSGVVYYEDPINLNSCGSWYMEFDIRTWDSWTRAPADGVAFAFLRDTPSGFSSGGGIGLPVNNNFGFILVYDTWANRWTNRNSVPLLHFQEILGSNSQYREVTVPINRPQALTNGIALPINLHRLGRANGYNTIRLEYDKGNISVFTNGVLRMRYTLRNQFNFSGYMLFSAATGGSVDRHSIRNARIVLQKKIETAIDREEFICIGADKLEIDAGIGYDTYRWTDDNGNYIGNTQKIFITKIGKYTVEKKIRL